MSARATNWSRVPIKTIYEGLYDGPHATPKPTEEGPVFLGIKNVTDDGQLNLSDIRHISEEEFPKWTKRVLPQEGDIVFTYEATLNRYAIIPSGFRGCLGRRMALIRPDSRKVDTRFLFHYFFSSDWRHTISKNILSGATVDRVPLTKFPDFEINLPPLKTQRKIATILSTYDDLIENNTRRIKILEEVAQTIYREWFVNFRFPGHEQVKLVDSPLGMIPEGWEVKTIGSLLCKVPRRKKIQKKDYLNAGEIPVIDQGREFIGGYTDDADALIKNQLPRIVFGDHTRILKFVDFPFACGADGTQLVMANTSKMPPELFYYTLLEIDLSSFGYARHFKFLKAEEIVVPDQKTASLYQQYGSSMRDLIRFLNLKNRNLRQARDLLLPKLISGAIDVSNLKIETKETAA
ncbi:MAG: restriction endonuclease subunit S [Geopsychrobacter sp.]|nr:restriction endonuclease subunit S [Geopsychrobacter sp.]